MRDGAIQEQGEARQIFEHPAHPYTKALMLCRPPHEARPMRLLTIEDIVRNDTDHNTITIDLSAHRARGYAQDDAPLLVVNHLRKSFYMREGFFGQREFRR